MKDHNFTFRVKSKAIPIVSIDTMADAAYVYFQRGVKVAKTIVRSEWPHVAVDLDHKGEVIGIEVLSPKELSINSILKKAEVQAPRSLISSARYFDAKSPELATA